MIDNDEKFIIDRSRSHKHLSFGAGIHRFVGDRIATLQLRILWEEILKENLPIEINNGRYDNIQISYVETYIYLCVSALKSLSLFCCVSLSYQTRGRGLIISLACNLAYLKEDLIKILK